MMPNDNLLLCVHRGADDDASMYWCTGTVQSDNTIVWSGDTRFTVYGQSTPVSAQGVTLAVYRGIIFCGWKDADGSGLRVAYWSKDLQSWGHVQMPYTASDCTPGLAVLGNELFYVFQGDGSTDMYFGRCSSWTQNKTMPPDFYPNWTGNVFSQGNQMLSRAGVVSYDSKLFCLHRGKPGEFNDDIWWCRWDSDLGNWTMDDNNKMMMSASGPGTAAFNGELFVIARGRRQFNNNDKHLYTKRYTYDSSGKYLKPVNDTPVRSGNETDVGSTLAVCNSNLYCVHPGNEDTLRWARWQADSETWTNDEAFPGNRSGAEVAVIAPGGAF